MVNERQIWVQLSYSKTLFGSKIAYFRGKHKIRTLFNGK